EINGHRERGDSNREEEIPASPHAGCDVTLTVSAEVLDEHQVTARAIHLSEEHPAAVRRQRHARVDGPVRPIERPARLRREIVETEIVQNDTALPGGGGHIPDALVDHDEVPSRDLRKYVDWLPPRGLG